MKTIIKLVSILAVVFVFTACSSSEDTPPSVLPTPHLANTTFLFTEENPYLDDVVSVVITKTKTLSFSDETHVMLRLLTEVTDTESGLKLSSDFIDMIGTYTIVNYTVNVHITQVKGVTEGQESVSDTNIFYNYSFDPSIKTLVSKDGEHLEKL